MSGRAGHGGAGCAGQRMNLGNQIGASGCDNNLLSDYISRHYAKHFACLVSSKSHYKSMK